MRSRLRSLAIAALASTTIAVGGDRAAAQEGLRTYATREARVKSNAPAPVAKAVGGRIDEYCAIFADFYDAIGLDKKSDNVIVARLFATQAEFAEFWRRSRSGDVPAAYFSADLNAIVLYADEGDVYLRQTVFHECSHQFLNRYVHDAPSWLNEGLAEYFEGWRISAEGKLLEKRPSLYDLLLLQRALRNGKGLPLEELVGMPGATFRSFGEEYPDRDPYLHYATAWGLVYASLHGGHEPDRERLIALLKDLNRKPRSDAFEGVDWRALQARFERTILALRAEPRDALDHVLVARGHLRGRDGRAAVEHYRAARAADPALRGVAYWLGLAYKLVGDRDAAVDELELARRESPKDPAPVYQLARIASGVDGFALRAEPERALRLAEQASDLAGGADPGLLMFLAERHLATGARKQGLVVARRAVQLADDASRPAYQERLEALERAR